MEFQVGDVIIYRKHKDSPTPGPRAVNVHPSEHGEDYAYEVDKFWVVEDVRPREKVIVARTRRGKRHQLRVDNPHLRKPNLYERLRWRDRFPALPQDGE